MAAAALEKLEDPKLRAAFEAALPDLWAREMYSGIYRPRWLEVKSAAGAGPSLAFVVVMLLLGWWRLSKIEF